MPRLIAAALVFAAFIAGIGSPATAQEDAGDKVNQLIVYGDDPCPQSTAEEITVCARKGEEERYRIPEVLREENSGPGNRSWTDRVQAYETVGASGIQSCSPAGAGGEFGCTRKLIQAAYAEKAESSDIRFGQLIAKAREERMATIDQEAAEQQARVEELEKEYDERAAAERAAGDGSDPAGQAELPPVGGVNN
jgi:hypothetical protein